MGILILLKVVILEPPHVSVLFFWQEIAAPSLSVPADGKVPVCKHFQIEYSHRHSKSPPGRSVGGRE